jgi:hypothetical protein
MIEKKTTIFDYINAIFYKKNIEFDKKVVSGYVLSLFLSYDNNLLEIVNKINQYQFQLSDERVFKYYMEKVPKGKRFIKFPKKTEKEKNIKKAMNELIEEYDISELEAKKFINFL